LVDVGVGVEVEEAADGVLLLAERRASSVRLRLCAHAFYA
jgi:hypothetical protein